MGVLVRGFEAIPYPELKEKLLALPELTDVRLDQATVVSTSTKFIQSHLSVLENNQRKPNMTSEELRRRAQTIPFYERLVVFYHIATQLITAP